MSTAAIAILVSIAAIVSGALVAGIGAVWRLGSKVGGFEAKLEAVLVAQASDKAAHAELAARIDDTDEHVALIDGRLQAVEARCEERREQSARFNVPSDDDTGGVPGPAGCG